SGRRTLSRSLPLGPSPVSFLPIGEGTQPRVSRQVCSRAPARLPAEETSLPPSHRRTRRAKTIRIFSAHRIPTRLGGLCQTCFRRTDSGAPLSRPLYPSGCDQQSPAVGVRRRARHLSLEGLRSRQ